MKILVLMPVYDTHEDITYAIYSKMPHEVKDKTFGMNMYSTYLKTIKKDVHPLEVYFDTLIAAEKIYEHLDEDEDIIILGNMPKKYKFDAVFSFQDNIETLPYEDKWLKKVEELIQDTNDEILTKYFNLPFYSAEDSQFNLTNCTATADFLAAYLQTDPKLDKIKREYEEKIKEIKRR